MKLVTFNGLGDAIYLRAVALHLLDQGEEVEIYTPWPELFDDLPVQLQLHLSVPADARRVTHDLNAPAIQGKNDFIARCLNAGINEPVELRLDWKIRNTAFVEEVIREAEGRRIFYYQPLRRTKTAEQASWAPRRNVYNAFIREHRDWFRVKVGHPGWTQLDLEQECELDLCGHSLLDNIDVAVAAADMFFGEACHVTALAQAINKPFTVMLPRRTPRNGQLTGEWLLVKPELASVVYDEPLRMAA